MATCPRCMPGRVEVRAKGNASCLQCGGGFVSLPQAFAALKKAGVDGARLQEILARDGRKIRPCVTCNQQFTSFPIGGEVLHACVSCGGFWTDKGTLDRLSGVSNEPPPPPAVPPRAPPASATSSSMPPVSFEPPPAATPPATAATAATAPPPPPAPPAPPTPAPQAPAAPSAASVLVEDIAPLPSAPPPSAGLIAPIEPPKRPDPRHYESLDPSLDPVMPAPPKTGEHKKHEERPKTGEIKKSTGEERPKTGEIKKPEADKERSKPHPPAPKPVAQIFVDQQGMSIVSKIGIGLVVVALFGVYLLYRGAQQPPSTPVGGGRAAMFWKAPVEQLPVALESGPVSQSTSRKDEGVLQATFLPKLPDGVGMDVVIGQLYGPGPHVTGSTKIGDVLIVRAEGPIAVDKDHPAKPARVRAYVGEHQAWILAALGDAANKPEADLFLASLHPE